ncbi:hypothetical protein EJ05DRAFT_534349 [Pseudovirgaria hyperparasitica]|uniref:Peroxin 11C n=1 Tax=Pseudovirgaria hyperparasitica TaxID=470096 RepID=A0A6A6WL38_9PEZI|nr:uncharacterized protein EJ05DRAFT_534349 [Pseudovirgaria hyperparasitica]KAF2762882.1 hypothetical protein EJ05DRAFT_534349 [Pseudovirgaria hyperparasitica]
MASFPPASNLKKLQSLIHAHTVSSLNTTDTLLLRASKLFSTPAGIDSALLTLQYTLKFASKRLQARLESQLAALAESIASKAEGALLPGETIVAEVPSPPGAKRIAKLSEGAGNLSAKISDVRMFMRLWGLLGMYAWARSTYAAPPKDTILKAIAWGQITVMTAFQFLENAVYLASQGVLNGEGWLGEAGARRKGDWMVKSCQCWVAYIGLDFVRLGYEWYKERNGLNEEVVSGNVEKEKEFKMAALQRTKDRNALWWRQFVKQAAYSPMALHYSVTTPLISDTTIGWTGMIAGISGLMHLWRQTA